MKLGLSHAHYSLTKQSQSAWESFVATDQDTSAEGLSQSFRDQVWLPAIAHYAKSSIITKVDCELCLELFLVLLLMTHSTYRFLDSLPEHCLSVGGSN